MNSLTSSGTASSLPKYFLIWRRSRLCRFSMLAFGQSGDRHGLIVQFALRAGRERGDFPVGIEARQFRGGPQDVAHPFDLLLDALPQDHLAPHAADEDREVGRGRSDRPMARLGRPDGAVAEAGANGLPEA